MKLNLIYKVDEIKAFTGLRDYFKDAIYVVINEDLKELRLYGKNPDYKKERKSLDLRKLNHVIVPKYLQVIDITKKVSDFIESQFPDYIHSEFQVWE